MHFGTSATVPMPSSDSPLPVSFALYGCNSMYSTADLVFSKLLQRFPGTKISLAEGGTGWVPWLLERLDYTWDRHRHYSDIPQDVKPSEVFQKNIWVCHIEDRTGVELRAEIGIDKIMWECDYPHSDSLWPESQESLLHTLADVPPVEVQAMVEDNARRLFNFDADLKKSG
jgi:predicted TIM-barrel fold metal-dependent hydrolase